MRDPNRPGPVQVGFGPGTHPGRVPDSPPYYIPQTYKENFTPYFLFCLAESHPPKLVNVSAFYSQYEKKIP